MSTDRELCTVQSFGTLPEAQMACARLDEAGIHATIFNESLDTWLAGFQSFSGLQVKVLTTDFERAKDVLEQEPWDEVIDWSEADRLAEGGSVEDEPKPDRPTTITAVPDDRNPERLATPTTPDYPHRCNTEPASSAAESSFTSLSASNKSPAENTGEPEAVEREADVLTRRAYKASLIGLLLGIFIPAIHIYSLVLLLMVAFSGEKASPEIRWKYWVAMLIDLAVTLLAALALIGRIVYIFFR